MIYRMPAVFLTATLLCACSASGTVPVANMRALAAKVQIQVPTALQPRSGASKRAAQAFAHQKSVAIGTQSLQLTVYTSGTRTSPTSSGTYDLSPNSQACAAGTNGRTCSFSLTVPATGRYDFVAQTYDAPPSNGSIPSSAHQLGYGVATGTISSSSSTIALTIGGVVGSTFVSIPVATLHVIDSLTQTITVGATDANGNTIVSDTYVDANGNAVTITPTANNASGGTVSFQPASFSAPQTGGVAMKFDATKLSTANVSGITSVITAAASNSVTAGTATISAIAPAIQEINRLSHPATSIAKGPDGNLWFTETWSDIVGYATPDGRVHEFSTGIPAGSHPSSMAAGPDGNMWFTEPDGSAIAKIAPATGTVTQYPVANGRHPYAITTGPDGRMWFTETLGSKIAAFDPNQNTPAIAEYAADDNPAAIGWAGANVYYGLSSTFGVYQMPTSGTSPALYSNGFQSVVRNMATDTTGRLWMTLSGSNQIGFLNTGTLTTFTVPTNGSRVDGITLGPDNAMWFVESAGNRIGRVLPDGTFAEFSTGISSNAQPESIVTGPDGALWFTELNRPALGRLQ